MRNVIIDKCLDVVRRCVAYGNVGGLGYVEKELMLEIEKNDFRKKSIENSKVRNRG